MQIIMKQNIIYTTHLAIQAKYTIVINIIIYTTIYIFIINAQIASCMMEENDLPQIAETKESPNYIVQDLMCEIKEFARTRIELLEQITDYKEELAKSKSEIAQLKQEF